jgi:hypothetical protein
MQKNAVSGLSQKTIDWAVSMVLANVPDQPRPQLARGVRKHDT